MRVRKDSPSRRGQVIAGRRGMVEGSAALGWQPPTEPIHTYKDFHLEACGGVECSKSLCPKYVKQL